MAEFKVPHPEGEMIYCHCKQKFLNRVLNLYAEDGTVHTLNVCSPEAEKFPEEPVPLTIMERLRGRIEKLLTSDQLVAELEAREAAENKVREYEEAFRTGPGPWYPAPGPDSVHYLMKEVRRLQNAMARIADGDSYTVKRSYNGWEFVFSDEQVYAQRFPPSELKK